jgi:hypothetical protein
VSRLEKSLLQGVGAAQLPPDGGNEGERRRKKPWTLTHSADLWAVSTEYDISIRGNDEANFNFMKLLFGLLHLVIQ